MKATLVKLFLVLNFMLCMGVIAYGVQVFQNRELVKARAAILRNQLRDVAEKLDYGEQKEWEDEAVVEGAFSPALPDSDSELQSMVASLETLETLAGARVEQLRNQYESLTAAKEEFAEASAALEERVEELQTIRTRVASLEETLSSTREQKEEAREEVANLEETRKELERQSKELDEKISSIQDEISSTREKLELRTSERDRMEALLAACRQPRNLDGSVESWKTQTARILAVEPEWNYVVINKGEADALPLYIEGFVHRGDEFAGKVRVVQVDDNVALAEILPDSTAPDMTIEAGDTLFF